ncbi:hypothetical protein L218DRAFT_958396 [Marasmius fiardii PR-910]|nr:hypothetical protein L218DRAFT_958396 [Marasmius fiardii PR-910]
MLRSLLPLVSLAAILPTLVSAHGQLRGVTIAGTWYDAPNLYYDGDARNQNTPIRKGYKADFPSYLLPKDFADDNKMACQEAGAAPSVAVVHPGDEVKWQWEGATTELSDQGYPQGTWVHAMGPSITYIGSCNGDCKSVDASQIKWQKIDFNGLNPGDIDNTLRNAMANKPEPYRSTGLWALASLIENGSQYSSYVPQGLKNGQYILRSELSAVHNPMNNGDPTTGPQNYVGCLQVEVQNGGDVQLPDGTKAGSLYDSNGDFAHYSVFTSPATFNEPGPAKWNGASGSSSSSQSSGTSNQGSSGDNSNNGQQSSGDNSNSGQQSGGDNSNSGQQSGGDNSNNGQQSSGDNSNNGQQSGGDSSNSGQQSGGDNSNSGQQSGGDSSNNGQQSSGDSSSSNNGGQQSSGDNSNSGNSTDNGTKQCRRRTSRKRSARGISKVARSLHAKRHH